MATAYGTGLQARLNQAHSAMATHACNWCMRELTDEEFYLHPCRYAPMRRWDVSTDPPRQIINHRSGLTWEVKWLHGYVWFEPMAKNQENWAALPWCTKIAKSKHHDKKRTNLPDQSNKLYSYLFPDGA